MTVNFYLERRKAYKKKSSRRQKTGLTIIMFIRFSGKLLKIGTGEKIHSRDWDTKTQRPRTDYELYDSLTKFLDRWELEVKRVKLEAEGPLSVQYFKDNLSFTRSHSGSFFECWDEYVTKQSRRVRIGTMQAYNTALKTFRIIDGTYSTPNEKERAYMQKYKSYKLDFSTIDQGFVDKLIDYCAFIPYTVSHCNLMLTHMKTFMTWAVKNKKTKHLAYRDLGTGLKGLPPTANIYFLLPDELARITHMDLDDENLDVVRDVFCFSCYTGLRISDVQNFKRGYVSENVYTLMQGKNRVPITNPLFEPALRILEKYQDLSGEYALPRLTTSTLDRRIKEIARMAGLDRKITVYSNFVGEGMKGKQFPLHDVISSHTGRKTFISHLINMGKSRPEVAAWTGQSEPVIGRYFEIIMETKQKTADEINKRYREDGEKMRKV